MPVFYVTPLPKTYEIETVAMTQVVWIGQTEIVLNPSPKSKLWAIESIGYKGHPQHPNQGPLRELAKESRHFTENTLTIKIIIGDAFKF